MIRRRPHLLVAATLALAALVAGGSTTAVAADNPSAEGVSITAVDASNWPTVRVAFGADLVSGKEPELAFFEGDKALPGASLYRGEIGEYQDKRRTDVMLVLDTSFDHDSLAGVLDELERLADQLIPLKVA